MSFVEIGFLGFAAVLLFIAIRVPIGIVLLAVSFCGVWLATTFQAAWGMVRAIPFDFVANWSFSAVPMFLMMGFIASNGGLTDGLFGALKLLLRRVPGGLGCAGVGACALFASASGSSVATAAAMSRIAVPEMLRANYDKGLATGVVASAGTLGSLIPPSITMVLFGIFTQTSIGQLFIAGFVPGIISALLYMLMIIIRAKINPEIAPPLTEEPSREDLKNALKKVWPLPLLIVGVLGGIFAGVMTPTEAGAVGASLALVLTMLRGTFSIKVIKAAARETAMGTSTVFMIAVGASMFTSFMGLTGTPNEITEGLLSLGGNDPVMLIIMIAIIYIVLGMFIDSIGLMLLTLPILLPLLEGAHVNMIWFGIIVVKLLEIGLITPPVGLNCYVLGSTLRGVVPLSVIFRGALWFILIDMFTLGLLIAFPRLTLWLPSIMH